MKIAHVQRIVEKDFLEQEKHRYYMFLTYSKKLQAIPMQISFDQLFQLKSMGIEQVPDAWILPETDKKV